MAIGAAQGAVQRTGDLPVPLHLRNAPTSLMKDRGYGRGYGYSHEGEGHFIDQEFLPEALSGTAFYQPGDDPRGREHAALIERLWKDRYKQG